MAEPTTQQEFIDYAYRALGQPVIKVNVALQQAQDRYTEALQYFQERHPEFQQRALFAHTITTGESTIKSFDVDTFGGALGTSGSTGAAGWPRGTDIVAVKRVYNPGAMYAAEYAFDIRYQMALFDVFGLYFNNFGYSANPIASYESSMQYIQLIQDMFNYPQNFTFNNSTRRLTMESSTADLQTSRSILVEAFVKVNPDQYTALYANRIFKKYYAACLKRQWADILSKVTNVPMVGGAKIDAAAMMQSALLDIQTIEAQIESQYIEPVLPIIG